MDYKGKKLLILGGAGPHVKVVESAKEMGIYTIVTDYLPDSPAKKTADESLMVDINDTDELIRFGSENHINGVLGFCLDPTQRPAHKIADALGLPVFGNEFQVMSLTEKGHFKDICRKAGVDTIPEYRETEIDMIDYPCIVKPAESRGSRGITVCRKRSEIESAIRLAKSVSNNGQCIIEKYMIDKQDLTISYIVKNGEPILVSLGDRYPGREEDNLNCQLVCTIQPSRYIDIYLKCADDKIKGMINLLGIENGPVFFQGFIDGNTVMLYDPGIRFPGNEYERIYKKATGMDLMKSIISYCVGGEIIDYDRRIVGSYDLNGKAAIQYMINFGPGKISEFSGLDKLKEHPLIIDIQQRHFIGETIENTGDIRHRAGEISVLCDRKTDSMKAVVQYIQSHIVAKKENGESILISPFDVNIIDKNYGDYL